MSKLLELLNKDIQFSNDDLTMEVLSQYIPLNFHGDIANAERNLNALLIIDIVLSKIDKKYSSLDIESTYFLYYDSFTRKIRFADRTLHGKSIEITDNRVVIGSAGFPMSELANHFEQYMEELISDYYDQDEYAESQDNYATFGISRYEFI